MPVYMVTDPQTGLKLRLTGDSPPTDADLDELFAQHQPAQAPQAEPTPEQPFDFSALEAVKNIPGSAANLAGDIWGAVTSPVETGKAVFGLAQSLGNKMGRNAAELVYGTKMDVVDGFSEDAANTVGQAMIDRYGSIDNIKRTVQNDPVGFMTDVSAAGLVSKIPKIAKIGAAVEPVNMARNTIRSATKAAIPDSAAKSLYESSAKFSTTMSPADRAKLTQTALDNEIMPTSKGVAKIESRINALDSSLDEMIDVATKEGKAIPVGMVFKHLKELRREKTGVKIEGLKDEAAINKMAGAFSRSLGNRKTLTPRELQDFKTDAYKKIGWDSKRMKGTPIKEETFKAMARGAKDAVADVVPKATNINNLMGDLLDLKNPLSQAASRIDNRNFISIDTPIKTGAGAAVGGAPGAILGALASIVGNPKSKAKLAIAINKIKANDTKWLDANSASAEVSVALALAGRLEEED